MKIFRIKLLFLFIFLSQIAFSADLFKGNPNGKKDSTGSRNWFNLDPKKDKVSGVGSEEAYRFLKDKKSKTIIVAILDSGVDIFHEDLKDNIWTNTGEIPGNGKDDDGNGFVDDIHGWNFLGNPSGENLEHETLEITRLFKMYHDRFGKADPRNLKDSEKADYALYLEYKKAFDAEFEEANQNYIGMQKFSENFDWADENIKKVLGKDDYTFDEVNEIESSEKEVIQSKMFLISLLSRGFDAKGYRDYKNYIDNKIKYHLNPNYDGRRSIVKDDPNNVYDTKYGNNDVKGAGADHGTHVAGIVAANRNNDLGMKGIADNVKIMSVRCVPDGDERDKDVANAINYAVNNGAKIINMSFGKMYSPQKGAVDAAIKNAENKGVLLIHAAGNDAKNIDKEIHYPHNVYTETGKRAENWITIGASSSSTKKYLPGDFSNYGKQNVDLFAPGVSIYSTVPENKYATQNGTSMASPVTAGVAALLWSYYPNLTAVQIKYILEKSTTNYKWKRVIKPNENGKSRKIWFKKLSKTGGVVNAYNAVQMAEKMAK